MIFSVERFPIGHVLLAGFIVPAFPLLAITIANELSPKPWRQSNSFIDFLLLIPAEVLVSWPGYVVFFLLGVPTTYLLYRWHHVGFLLFAVIGAIYTSLAVCLLVHPYPFTWPLYFDTLRASLPLFAGLGAGAGVLTRLIVFGRRLSKDLLENQHTAPGELGQTP